MATLVLTVIGGSIGGPIGAAIGSVVGQAIDRNILFKPKGREGPRLTELAVQTSSYGTPIPLLFGALRVAGTVIWSTDLIESKSKTSAKGQPTVTNYSYAASFAVLLSARPITGVGRIWADGKLLRGAAGDFKTMTGFRLHLGGEDQPVDPLIASAEGLAMTPAMRGHAYAVFEQFQLADYGNRIPSLTFEVIADPAPVSVGSIAATVSAGRVDGADVAQPLAGFSAYGDSVRGVLETLALAGDAWFAPDGDRLVMRDRNGPATAIDDAGVAAPRDTAPRRARTIAAIETVPQTVTLTHYDPARDYQTGLQRARRPGPGARSDRIELPAAIDSTTAKAIAERSLANREAARERRQVALPWTALTLLPGDRVTINGEAARWRVQSWSLEAMVLGLDLVRLDQRPAIAMATASSGRVAASPDALHGPTILHAFELPTLDDTVATAPRLMIAAAGVAPGWRRAALLISSDGGTRFTSAGATALPATIGTLAAPPGVAPATLRDLASAVEVTLAHAAMTLTDADDAAIDGGANLALIGDELIQFGIAEQLSATRWRLSRLLRGRRGTEAAIGTKALGDRFVLIEPESMAAIDLPLSKIGATVRVLASGTGDVAGPASANLTLQGRSVQPPSPIGLVARADGDGGLLVRWTRRSRSGWRWSDGSDSPLTEEREAYRATISPMAGAPRDIAVEAPMLLLAAADWSAGDTIAVRQIGTNRESAAAVITLA